MARDFTTRGWVEPSALVIGAKGGCYWDETLPVSPERTDRAQIELGLDAEGNPAFHLPQELLNDPSTQLAQFRWRPNQSLAQSLRPAQLYIGWNGWRGGMYNQGQLPRALWADLSPDASLQAGLDGTNSTTMVRRCFLAALASERPDTVARAAYELAQLARQPEEQLYWYQLAIDQRARSTVQFWGRREAMIPLSEDAQLKVAWLHGEYGDRGTAIDMWRRLSSSPWAAVAQDCRRQLVESPGHWLNSDDFELGLDAARASATKSELRRLAVEIEEVIDRLDRHHGETAEAAAFRRAQEAITASSATELGAEPWKGLLPAGPQWRRQAEWLAKLTPGQRGWATKVKNRLRAESLNKLEPAEAAKVEQRLAEARTTMTEGRGLAG